MIETLTAGRDAVQRHAWAEAVEALSEADEQGGLSPADLELLADAAWWSGVPDTAADALERAFAGYMEAGRRSGAANVALRLGYLAMRRLAASIAAGWLARAERLLEDEPESDIEAWMNVLHGALALYVKADMDSALEYAEKALDLGRKHGSLESQSLALSFKGQILIRRGSWREGLALIDEATAIAMSGDLDLRAASDVYCSTIAACRSLSDYRRAGEWTDEADRWMRRQSVGGYPGVCKVYRAELKLLRGSWSEAEQEAKQACEELESYRLLADLGFAHYEIGEVRLRMGDLSAAEESFLRAYEYGWDPQPGMALLQLARGEVEEASRSLSRSLSGDASGAEEVHSLNDPLTRARLLPTQVDVSLARNDVAAAAVAVAELEGIAREFQQPALEAAALTARGALDLATERPDAATDTLRRAWRGWLGIDIPYEAARARTLLGRALLASGDESGARLELRAARATFERLGAALDVQMLNELVGEGRGTGDGNRVTRTFMFTDIVTSTDLVGLIGDAAWQQLLSWHDGALRAAFAQHRGEVVRHTGDGFFVTFDMAEDAVKCAVTIQRSLNEHRRDHGFAPWVRIGLHTAEAARQGTDYAGQAVHIAARVGDLAEREQIVATAATLAAIGETGVEVSEPRSVSLKGVSDPVEVHTVDWA